MKQFYLLIYLFSIIVLPFKTLAQNKSQKDVVDQINLGVKYLSEKEHI